MCTGGEYPRRSTRSAFQCGLRGMADRNRVPDRRLSYTCAHRHVENAQSARRARVRPIAQREGIGDGGSLRGTHDDRLDLCRYELLCWPSRSSESVRNPNAADEWFRENDPEGVAFGYEVLGDEARPRS